MDVDVELGGDGVFAFETLKEVEVRVGQVNKLGLGFLLSLSLLGLDDCAMVGE